MLQFVLCFWGEPGVMYQAKADQSAAQVEGDRVQDKQTYPKGLGERIIATLRF